MSQTFKLSGATTAESRMTSDGFVSGSAPSLLAAVAFLRFTKRRCVRIHSHPDARGANRRGGKCGSTKHNRKCNQPAFACGG